MDYESISPEIKEKALACTSAEELIALAKSEGIELAEEELDGIAGGTEWDCSDCGKNDTCCTGASVSQGTLGLM